MHFHRLGSWRLWIRNAHKHEKEKKGKGNIKTISKLLKYYNNLLPVTIERILLGKGCYSEDSFLDVVNFYLVLCISFF